MTPERTAIFQRWKSETDFDQETRAELELLISEGNAQELEDRFYKDIEFGTGGIRALMGAGTNRLNRYTVARTTEGLARYLLDTFGAEACAQRGTVIAYDTRVHSAEFANVTASVLSGMGIQVRLFDAPRPTPQLSFAVRHFGSLAGVVITASHNPKEYNGYKVYDENGCQLVPKQAKAVSAYIAGVDGYEAVRLSADQTLIEKIDVTDAFVCAVLKQSRLCSSTAKRALKVVYTPLHGTGQEPVLEALRRDGFTGVQAVENQSDTDGRFPTVRTPNPEDPQALIMAVEQATPMDADLVLATDPDCDRVGIAVRSGKQFKTLTGNQTGALLTDFVLANTQLEAMANPVVLKTIVTSDLGADIARKYGLMVLSTLTGFKYIGEKIARFGQEREHARRTFVLGYEESYGYLVGNHVLDKDGVVASMLICEAAAYWKAQGMTLVDRLDVLHKEFGFYLDAQDGFTFKGQGGHEQMQRFMNALRSGEIPFGGVKQTIDYRQPQKLEDGVELLPSSNVLKFMLEGGSWVAIRPSGTEPKLKVYYSIHGTTAQQTEEVLGYLRSSIKNAIDFEGEA